MLRVVIYGPDQTENHRVRELLEDILWEAEVTPVFREFSGERGPFFAYVKNNPYLVMLVLQPGAAGAETVRLARSANPETRIVWFSDRDYALYAFDLRLTFFGLFPVSGKELESALSACCSSRRYPPWGGTLSLPHIAPFSQQRIRPIYSPGARSPAAGGRCLENRRSRAKWRSAYGG